MLLCLLQRHIWISFLSQLVRHPVHADTAEMDLFHGILCLRTWRPSDRYAASCDGCLFASTGVTKDNQQLPPGLGSHDGFEQLFSKVLRLEAVSSRSGLESHSCALICIRP